ncbi:hypothetical protein V1505DRAFT_283185, partial [Lipomyces doorenjongii]
CNNLDEGEHQSLRAFEPLARLRIIALLIHRSPQRRQTWNDNCKRMNLADKFIEYDVDTRVSSTFRMLTTNSRSSSDIRLMLQSQDTSLSSSSTMRQTLFRSISDWLRLSQIHHVHSKFDELTLFVSQKKSQIIYYELHDLLHDVAERKEDYADLEADISSAVKAGIKMYMKYYTFLDASDTYYTALILDPRVKGNLFQYELDDKYTSG